jgi:hypothetical protein
MNTVLSTQRVMVIAALLVCTFVVTAGETGSAKGAADEDV